MFQILKTVAARFAAKPATPAKPDAAQLSRDHFSDAWMGWLTQSSEIDETLRLAGVRRHQLRRLCGDDEVSTALETRRAAVEATPWRIDGYSDTPAMQHLAAMLNTHWGRIVYGAWDAVPMGYSVMEAIWGPSTERRGGVDLQRIGLVPMQYFNPRPDGTLLCTLPSIGSEQQADSAFKFFETVRDQSVETPHGVAALAPLYWPWHFRQSEWRYWMQFVERFGAPIVTGKVINPQEFVDAMASLGINTAIGVGPSDDVNVITQGLAGEFERLDMALSKRIQKMILGQTLTTDVGKAGSYAAASVHDLVRMDRRNADQKLVAATAQRVINAFWLLNRYPGDAPKLLLEDGKGLEQDRAARDALLVQHGVITLTDQYMLTHYDYEPGDFVIGQPAQQAAQPPATLSAIRLSAGRAREGGKFTPGQQLVEGICDLAIASAPPLVDKDELKAAITESANPDELLVRLAEIMRNENSAAFVVTLEKATKAAEVLGWANAEMRRY